MYVNYRLFSALPSRGIHRIESICKMECIGDLIKCKSTLFFEIGDIECDNKKVAFIDWKLLDLLNGLNRYSDFHEESSNAIREILLASKKLHVIELGD